MKHFFHKKTSAHKNNLIETSGLKHKTLQI